MIPVYVLMKDLSHFGDVTQEQIRLAFGSSSRCIVDPDAFPWDALGQEKALYILAKENNILNTDGSRSSWITPEREKKLYDYVCAGGGALFLHNGLVGYPEGSLWHKLAGGVFVTHPMIQPVTYYPLRTAHPITAGVTPFCGEDEHYFCRISLTDVDVFMGSVGQTNGTAISGWCQQIGQGRTVAITPGHTQHIVRQESLIHLLRNAAAWLTGACFHGKNL